MMKLPGGLWLEGRRHREFAFKPMIGTVELALAEATQDTASMPEVVTRALTATLKHLNHQEATPSTVDALSVGDRQFLIQRLASWLELDPVWMTATCLRCATPFDFQIRFTELPVKKAESGYPFARIDTSRGSACWRVPTGADQKAVATESGTADAATALATRCLVEVNGHDTAQNAQWVAGLSKDDWQQVESALEAVAPAVTTAVQVGCMECQQMNEVGIDPYFCLQHRQETISADIHTIASAYHWSETEILSLPRQRRRRYLQLIDRARGMTH